MLTIYYLCIYVLFFGVSTQYPAAHYPDGLPKQSSNAPPSTFLNAYPHFQIPIHTSRHLSTSPDTYPHLQTLVHISIYLSTPDTCPHLQIRIHSSRYFSLSPGSQRLQDSVPPSHPRSPNSSYSPPLAHTHSSFSPHPSSRTTSILSFTTTSFSSLCIYL